MGLGVYIGQITSVSVSNDFWPTYINEYFDMLVYTYQLLSSRVGIRLSEFMPLKLPGDIASAEVWLLLYKSVELLLG